VAGGVQFAVWAPEAEAVWLCLFDDSGHHELQRLPVPHVHLGIWHATVPGVGPGQVYGWRVAGPWQPAQGLRFNPQRVLLDPYAHAVVGCYAGDLDRYLDFDPADPRRPHPQDNGDIALKARVQAPARAPVVDVPPVPLGHRVVAEVHVRSATALHPEVPEALRGTYAGLAHPALIAHWRQLGVTTLELMPVQARADEARLQRRACPTTGATRPSASWRRSRATPAGRAGSARPRSCARPSPRCGGPASRWCWTWCSTTAPKPTCRGPA
jgi:glycogen operon protein